MHERPTGRERARERRHRSIGPIDFARVHEAAERSGGIQILGPPPLAAAAAEGVAPVSAQSASLVGFSERPELPGIAGQGVERGSAVLPSLAAMTAPWPDWPTRLSQSKRSFDTAALDAYERAIDVVEGWPVLASVSSSVARFSTAP